MRITVVGSINLDLVATAPSLPAPGETVTGATLARHPGGKGANQAFAAEKLGAALEIMEDAWWGPTVPLVDAPWFALSERNSPGSIIVNMAGKRFMNEALPYVEAVHHKRSAS